MFNKSVNTHCGIDKLVWKDANDNECSLVCFYQSGPNAGKSKGLFNLCKELKIPEENTLSKAIKLTDLRILASNHPAFKRKSKQEDLIQNLNSQHNLNIRLIYLPKLHCEFNPIEMFWAQLKNDLRQGNDQDSIGDLLLERI